MSTLELVLLIIGGTLLAGMLLLGAVLYLAVRRSAQGKGK
jgi:hypothetical protein